MSPGDEQRFRELYDRTYDRVWAFVLRRFPDEDAALDVMSDTYLAVWRRMADVPGDPRLADAWVFGTARRVLANVRRGAQRRTNLFERIRQRRVDVFANEFGSEESNSKVIRALDQLRPAQREILLLAYWEELDTDQIAQVLGCSENAAAIRLTRARQALHREVEATSDQPDGTGSDGDKGGER